MSDDPAPAAAERPPDQPVPVTLPETTHRAPKGSGCGSRWVGPGCMAGLGVVIVVLILSTFTLDTGFKMLVTRARVQIWRNLPPGLEQGQRMRTYNNLTRFADRVDQLEDGDAVIGKFLAKAAAALEDRSLSRDEVDDLNLFLESVINPPQAEGIAQETTPTPAARPAGG